MWPAVEAALRAYEEGDRRQRQPQLARNLDRHRQLQWQRVIAVAACDPTVDRQLCTVYRATVVGTGTKFSTSVVPTLVLIVVLNMLYYSELIHTQTSIQTPTSEPQS